MKVVIQRVREASVAVNGNIIGRIQKGMLIFLGIAKGDTLKEVDYCARKLAELRMFQDGDGKINLSIKDVGGEILVVSQFTLLGSLQKGRRPSFDDAAEPSKAEEVYALFVNKLREYNLKVATGEFRAMMDVRLINDGPVTFILET